MNPDFSWYRVAQALSSRGLRCHLLRIPNAELGMRQAVPRYARRSYRSEHFAAPKSRPGPHDRIVPPRSVLVTLELRGKEFQVKGGTTLLAALEKADILPESVIATRDGEMILEDEILHDGDVVKLVAVISGG